MTTDPDLPELAREIAGFEAARIARPVHLEPTPIRSILAVRDGSDQDATVVALAQAAAELTGATVSELRPSAGDAHQEILAATDGHDLVLVPCPYGADYAAVGTQTLSTTLDVVLARGRTPTCLVRGPIEDATRWLHHPVVALDVHRARKVEATALALTLARGGGTILLSAVIDPSQPIADQQMLGLALDLEQLQPDVLAGVASARTATLTAALQRCASELRVLPRVKLQIGSVVDLALVAARHEHGIVVAGLARGTEHVDASCARQLVLRSELPVLLV